MPPILKIGIIAMAKTIIPSPPNHWRTALHIKIPEDKFSTLLYTVAPVVVSPEVASKIASI